MQLLEHDDGATQVPSIVIKRSPVVTTIVLDKQLLGRFTGIHEEAEVRDESGNLCGRFVPISRSNMPFVPPFTKEELDRAAAEPGGRSLAEILADLESRS